MRKIRSAAHRGIKKLYEYYYAVFASANKPLTDVVIFFSYCSAASTRDVTIAGESLKWGSWVFLMAHRSSMPMDPQVFYGSLALPVRLRELN